MVAVVVVRVAVLKIGCVCEGAGCGLRGQARVVCWHMHSCALVQWPDSFVHGISFRTCLVR